MRYTNKGYINIENKDLKNLSIFFGGRGLGKTFSILQHRIEDALENKEGLNKFIWLRDSAEIVKKLAAGESIAAPINRIYENLSPKDRLFSSLPPVTIEKVSGNFCFVANAKTDNALEIGYLMALSTFHNARGISYESVKTIVWDEFIPEEGTIVKKNQGIIFLNAYETVNRNRELEGEEPTKIIFLSNTNDIYSDVLEDLGVSGIIEDMMQEKKNKFINDDIRIDFLSSEAFFEQKKDTFIYRITQNDKFKDVALNNKFINNEALIKRNPNLKGSKGLFNINNKYCCIQLQDDSIYYKLGSWKGLMNYDMDNEQEALLYRLLFTDKLRLSYIAGNMFFDSIYTQRNILELSRI